MQATIASRPHYLFSLLGTFARFEKALENQASVIDDYTTQSFRRIKALQDAKEKRIEELNTSNDSKNRWENISSVTQDTLSVSTLAAGAYSLKEGEPNTGSLLTLAGGVTSIANRVFKATGLYDWVSSFWSDPDAPKETSAPSYMETGMNACSWALSLGGAALSIGSGNIQGGLEAGTRVVSGLTNGLMSVHKSSIEKTSSEIGADVQKKTTEISLQSQDLLQQVKTAERLAHTNSEVIEIIKSLAENQFTKD